MCVAPSHRMCGPLSAQPPDTHIGRCRRPGETFRRGAVSEEGLEEEVAEGVPSEWGALRGHCSECETLGVVSGGP